MQRWWHAASTGLCVHGTAKYWQYWYWYWNMIACDARCPQAAADALGLLADTSAVGGGAYIMVSKLTILDAPQRVPG